MRFAQLAATTLVIASLFPAMASAAADQREDIAIAADLARLMVAAREVISERQALINDPTIGDKGMSGEQVLRAALEVYLAGEGRRPEELAAIEPSRLAFAALKRAIVRAVDEIQDLFNEPGVGFKGYVPSVFFRDVTRHFERTTGGLIKLKVTGPLRLVRTRHAKPDAWEKKAIEWVLSRPVWPHGKIFSTAGDVDGRPMVRVLVPEYYSRGCLVCHGGPPGNTDVTGYEKEGGKLGEIGGVISVTIKR